MRLFAAQDTLSGSRITHRKLFFSSPCSSFQNNWRHLGNGDVSHIMSGVFFSPTPEAGIARLCACVRVYPSHVDWCCFTRMGSVGQQVREVARKSCVMCNDAYRINWPARGQARCVVSRRNRGVCMCLPADLFVSSSARRPHPGRAGEPFRVAGALPQLQRAEW